MAGHHEQLFNTTNYVWNTRERLGIGATGAVYVGYHKTSGNRVAVKMFTGGPQFKSIKREIDVVKQLPKHENIVELFGVEEDRNYRSQVIIMELCTNGSLFDVIDSPENAYGLSETEFKQVIYDVAKGLQHLRSHNFVHRDIKPGNIMRCQKPDGSFVFKLADFGTARELDPGEKFISLHGTEEYLYPGMYERALINPQKKEQFSAKVDLWSVGATFFHAATGRLPFQPFRKREDRDQMFKIISEKPHGMVSGWQIEERGKIIYSHKLPNDIRLSTGMADLTTEVLVGLMENDISKMWEFDQFFKQIERIHRKKVVDVFCVATCTCHKIFIDPDDPDGQRRLMEGIEAQTALPIDHQELFFDNLPYSPTDCVTASQLPITTPDRPIMVFGGNSKNPVELHSPPLPTLPSAPQGLSLDLDLRFAKDCAKVIYHFKYQVEQVERSYRLTHQAALCYCYTVRHEYSLLEKRLSSIDELNKATCKVLTSQMAGLTSLNDIVSALNQATSGRFHNESQAIVQLIRGKEDQLHKVKEKPDLLQSKIDKIKQDFNFMDTLWDSKKGGDVFYRSNESIQYVVMVVDKDFKTFQRERKHKSLNTHEQKVHGFTKQRLQDRLGQAQHKMVALLSARMQVHSSLTDWLLRMIPLRADVALIEKLITEHSGECTTTLNHSDQWEGDHKRIMDTVNQKIASGGFSQPGRPPKPHPDHIEIPLYLCARLKKSRTDLSTAIGQQRELLNRLNCIPNGAGNPQGSASRHLTSRSSN